MLMKRHLLSVAAAAMFAIAAPAFAASTVMAGTVDKLLLPDMKPQLTGVLTYHVVAGKLDMAALKQKITAGGGMAVIRTVSGGSLTAKMNGPSNIVIEDAQGNTADITTYDVYQSNGVIHVVDKVLMPAM
jgi:uncharacterized surface protein with fasciclin (FAS1) repeats